MYYSSEYGLEKEEVKVLKNILGIKEKVYLTRKNLVCINFNSEKILSFKVYNSYSSIQPINLKYKIIYKFLKYTDSILFLNRYGDKAGQKMYLNLKEYIFIDDFFILFLRKFGFEEKILQKIKGKGIFCIASSGGKDLEIYISNKENIK